MAREIHLDVPHRGYAELAAYYERLHTAATRVVQLVTHNSSDLEVGAAIAELRQVLAERGGGQ